MLVLIHLFPVFLLGYYIVNLLNIHSVPQQL